MGPLVRRRVARGACAAIASALIAAGLARADALDDWAKAIDGVVAELSRPGAQDEFDKIFGDRLKKAGRLLFVDHEYSVTKGSFGSSGWTIPELPYVMGDTPPVGPQLYARWATKGKTGREHESLAVAVKFTHVDKFGDALKTTIGGTAHPNSDAGALVAAWHKEWVVRLKEYREPAKEGEAAPPPAEDNSAEPPSKEEEAAARDRKTWLEPGKRSVGLAKFSAVAQGTEKEGGQRWRREWYAWADKKATYVVFVRIGSELLVPNSEGIGKGKHFVEAIRVYK